MTRRNLLHIEQLEDRLAPSASGLLDPTFGTAGRVQVAAHVNAVYIEPFATVDPLGRTIISCGSSEGLLIRVNLDGTPDSTYGIGGTIGSAYGGSGIIMDAAGHVILGGSVRLTPTGETQPTFSTGSVYFAGAATFDAAGNIVVAANPYQTSDHTRFAVLAEPPMGSRTQTSMAERFNSSISTAT
jgi:hypothetical protein